MPKSYNPQLPFAKKLVLNKFLFSLFGANSLEELATHMDKISPARQIEADFSNYCYSVLLTLPQNATQLTQEKLFEYDQNITLHTKAIRGKRPAAIEWKYFQYLALLFNEIFLDRYFSDKVQLTHDLNNYVKNFNARMHNSDHVDPFSEQDLNKLAFWCATGSGKTLLMHVNIKQYLHYFNRSRQLQKLNRILLVTPNEGLSKQHLREFELSGIKAAQFSKNESTLFAGEFVEVIEITKLTEGNGEKTVDLAAFEGNNLVLVDEGHRGAKGEVWHDRRKKLAEHGFTYEYSATIGQAISANKELTQEYAKSVIFDYSYKFFYNDGYGKEFRIFNLPTQQDANSLETYLTGCLVSMYQQKILFKDKAVNTGICNIENPLLVFVGSRVTKSISKEDITDIVQILLFLAKFTATGNKRTAVNNIRQIISGDTVFLNNAGLDIFANMYPYLRDRNPTPENIYDGILAELFNAAGGASLHVADLKSADGEIALRIGDNLPFAVISVGDTAKLCKICSSHDSLAVSEDQFNGSLFHEIESKASSLNMLIGSRKFTEGWNSWRVSSMVLMNIGRKEGSQIIQLFGRGVRLKGYKHTLMRHSRLEDKELPYNHLLAELETLNIFGIRADYMDNFKSILDEEGIPNGENVAETIIPVIPTLGEKKLKIMRLSQDRKFVRDGGEVTLDRNNSSNKIFISLDYYPKIQSLISQGIGTLNPSADKYACKFSDKQLSLLDFERMYFDLHACKCEHSWHNLTITKSNIQELFNNDDWYEILIPADLMHADSCQKIDLWQGIATKLVEKYCERHYRTKESIWEAPLREYKEIDESDPDFISEYKLHVDKSQEQIIQQIEQIREQINSGSIPTIDYAFGKGQAIFFDRHLYQPLLYSEDGEVRIGQVSLNKGEKQFIIDLRTHFRNNHSFFKSNELYILRNLSRGRGVGFFEAGNFYPDFILWLVCNDKQYISFIDPKGLVQVDSSSKKIDFHRTIKEIEIQMGDKNVILNSFILSVTPYRLLHSQNWGGGWTKQDFRSKHIYFQEDQNYVEDIINSIII